MENEEIKNFLIGTSLTKVLLESSKEEYLEMGCDESKYEKRIEFAKYMVEKIDAASPRHPKNLHTKPTTMICIFPYRAKADGGVHKILLNASCRTYNFVAFY
ncbi:hypothetical protein Y032_0003g1379 [Ancylostoma ceylanicum]|uniref:Uncharacterized protein n=1 Tax=Ancylostoma ceylanicum TaxID=53326 RepID=A0A016VZA7_9BILA|nr:hypothetical protein Y032_0003g1379 [Ancylostoma ceylanicum]